MIIYDVSLGFIILRAKSSSNQSINQSICVCLGLLPLSLSITLAHMHTRKHTHTHTDPTDKRESEPRAIDLILANVPNVLNCCPLVRNTPSPNPQSCFDFRERRREKNFQSLAEQ